MNTYKKTATLLHVGILLAALCALRLGAADIVERSAPESVRHDIAERLMSIEPDQAWEGGMFLTERQGGSDVGANTMRAVEDGEEWRLFGDCDGFENRLIGVIRPRLGAARPKVAVAPR